METTKTLQTLQTLARLGRTLSKLAAVFAAVGFFGCLAGILWAALGSGGTLTWGGVTLHGILYLSGGLGQETAPAVLSGWGIVCAGEAVLAWFAQRCFTAELAAGTPFTAAGAGELRRLGILTLCLPLGCAFLGDVVQAVIAGHLGVTADFAMDLCFDQGGSVVLGIMFLVMSLLCRLGAEQQEA